MDDSVDMEPEWVERVCSVPSDFHGSNTIGGLFRSASPDLTNHERFTELVRSYLARHPDLVVAWQGYSYDKRTTPSPYLDGTEVGFYSGGRRNVRIYEEGLDACADFIYRESKWILQREED